MVQDQVVDAVLVSALGFGLFDQDAGPAGRAWSEGLPASVDDGDAGSGYFVQVSAFGSLVAPITGRSVWDCRGHLADVWGWVTAEAVWVGGLGRSRTFSPAADPGGPPCVLL